MIRGKASLRYELIHAIVQSSNGRVTVSELCEYAEVSRSGYYRWVSAKDARMERELQDRRDFELIRQAYDFRGYDKGSRGICMRLLHMGVRMNRKKIIRLMKKYDLFCPIRKANPYRRMAKALRTNAVADNLLKRAFCSYGPRQVLLTDITFIPVGKKFVYLAVILDLCTKQVLSYELSESLEVDLVLNALENLAAHHPECVDSEVMIHSDQGFHYTSTRFRKLIGDLGLRQSMSRRGNCWDNAPQESFFGHMKDELRTASENWCSPGDVRTSIDDWMDYYNNDRYHWDLQKLSPNEYYEFITTGAYPDGMCFS
jgi:transposase InsO family protein